MTDNPSDHRDPPPRQRSDAPVATQEWGERPSGDDSSDRNSVATRDTKTNGAHLRRGARRSRDGAANGNGRRVRGPAVGKTPQHSGSGRVHVNWRHALLAGLMCFAVWLVLDGPTLLRSAQDSPLGARRTVAIDVLRPIAAFSNGLGLSHVESAADRAIGHTGTSASGGVLQIEGVHQ